MKPIFFAFLRKVRRIFSALLRKPQPHPGNLQSQIVNDTPPLSRSLQDYFLIANYQSRPVPDYCDDSIPDAEHKIYQPDVYSLAECLASLGTRRIIDFGCGKGEKLKSMAARFDIIGIDIGLNIDYCRTTYPFGRWITYDFETEDALPIASSELQNSIVICADVIEHLINPLALLRSLKQCADDGARILLSTPERELVRGRSDSGPPENPNHVREWTIGELRALLLHIGFRIPFLGLTANNNIDREMSTIVAILSRIE
jgi:SAM-dependent methyltransferase